jgi:hypothetical protein
VLAPAGVQRDLAVVREVRPLDERAALALRTEADVLQLHDHRDGVVIVQLVEVHLLDAQVGVRERLPRGPRDARGGDVRSPTRVGVDHPLAVRLDLHGRFGQPVDVLGPREQEPVAGVDRNDGVEEPDRVREDRRVEVVLDGDRLVHVRQRVQRRVLAVGDRDLPELLGLDAVFVLVAVLDERDPGVRPLIAPGRHVVRLEAVLGRRDGERLAALGGFRRVRAETEHRLDDPLLDGDGALQEQFGRAGAAVFGHHQPVDVLEPEEFGQVVGVAGGLALVRHHDPEPVHVVLREPRPLEGQAGGHPEVLLDAPHRLAAVGVCTALLGLADGADDDVRGERHPYPPAWRGARGAGGERAVDIRDTGPPGTHRGSHSRTRSPSPALPTGPDPKGTYRPGERDHA